MYVLLLFSVLCLGCCARPFHDVVAKFGSSIEIFSKVAVIAEGTTDCPILAEFGTLSTNAAFVVHFHSI
jgi:hypothetical protein